MGNVAVWQQQGAVAGSRFANSFGRPFEVVPDLRDWDPRKLMFGMLSVPWSILPPIDPLGPQFHVEETVDAFLFSAEVAGMKEEDLDVVVDAEHLTVQGRSAVAEVNVDRFALAFSLPAGIDPEHVTAALDAGLLVIEVGKLG